MKTKKTTAMGLCIAMAMILSYVESQIPAFYAIPGIKIGLANIVVVFALYKFGWKEAVLISFVRIFLIATLFGSAVSLLYSVAGAVLSLGGMMILKKLNLFSEVAVSVSGGVLHNLGQILMAMFIMGTELLAYYFPFLMFSGILSGVVIGVLAAAMVKKITIKL